MVGLGEKIRAEREELGFTQSKMAKAIPMNQSNYSKIERDIQEPSIEQFKRICEILKLDANYLLDIEAGDMPQNDRKLLKAIKLIIKKFR